MVESVRWTQWRLRGSTDDRAVRPEPRPVARTIPGALRVVPVDDAPHVRADGGPFLHGTVLIAIDSYALTVQAQHTA